MSTDSPKRHVKAGFITLPLLVCRPVGSGKTALTLALCQKLRNEYNIGMQLLHTQLTSVLIIPSPHTLQRQ